MRDGRDGTTLRVMRKPAKKHAKKKPAKKRPCSVCRKWFVPDRRALERQRCCGDPDCRHTQHLRTERRWREKHPEAGALYRARKKLSRIRKDEAGSGPPVVPPPAVLRRVPWELARDEIGVKVTVLLGILTRLLVRTRRDEMRAQVQALLHESGRLLPRSGGDDMACGLPSCQGPP